VDPQLKAFIDELRAGMDHWLSEISLPQAFADRTPLEAVRELNVILRFVLRTGGSTYLQDLTRRGVLPLGFQEGDRQMLCAVLKEGGRSSDEIAYILGSASG
jgi:hypothetical protein